MTDPYCGRPLIPSARDERRAEAVALAAASLSVEITVEDDAWSWRVLDRATELEADGGCDSEAEARRKAEEAAQRKSAAEALRETAAAAAADLRDRIAASEAQIRAARTEIARLEKIVKG